MKTAAECLAKAADLVELARTCGDEISRVAYLDAADGWRRIALLARQQEVWDEARPGG